MRLVVARAALLLVGIDARRRTKAAPPPPPAPPVGLAPLAVTACIGLLLLWIVWRRRAANRAEQPEEAHTVCSLVFSDSNNGCLLAVWHRSTEPKEDALAVFAPKSPVPAARLSHNAGRDELARNVGGPNATAFYAGWCLYISHAHKSGLAPVRFLRNVASREVAISTIRQADSRVRHWRVGDVVALQDAAAIAVHAALETRFDVLAMPILQFKQLGNKLGATLVFDKSEAVFRAGSEPKLETILARRSSQCEETSSGGVNSPERSLPPTPDSASSREQRVLRAGAR